ncbi:MAG TPA: peptide ABC transporter substrate-binding protein [Alphaproteobacteria bacterium]|nr:peptide ABC transporter substrate-binding protein [Alphaproteobacteria bacterium]
MPHKTPFTSAIVAGLLLACVVLVLSVGNARAEEGRSDIEPPFFASAVAEGSLPPIAARLPDQPLVVDLAAQALEPGNYGGTLRTLITKSRDIRYMVVNGYARLVGRDARLRLLPDILQSYEVTDERIFTFRLRPGHRWSDGHPFTAEDFRYYWEDIATNPELSPAGPPALMLADGALPQFEVIDPLTVRYRWSSPNPAFLSALAQARPPFIYRPAHYLGQFHIRYADPDRLAAMIASEKVRNWAALHNRRDNMYKFDNIDMPTLQPWVNRTPSPAAQYVFERNPYYHRVDAAGRQLPYIDRVVMQVADGRLIAAKTNAGETDLQARGLSFSDITVLRQGEARNGYQTRLWPLSAGAHMALYPNLNYERPVWRALFRDVRFRRALSLGIDRHLINRSLFFGLALEGNNMVLPTSPLFEPALQTRWAVYNRAVANRMLDALELTARDGRGIRLLPDGQPLRIIVETAGESSEQVDILELIAADWKMIGIDLLIKPSQREVMRNRAYAGKAMMTVWSGFDTGMPTADMPPDMLAPMAQDDLQWPRWGQYYQTGGKGGEPPDMAEPVYLLTLAQEWRGATPERRRAIWREMLNLHADAQYTIGIIAGVQQPVVVADNLRNVPQEAFYGWDPGAQFGIYRPDQFWFADAPDVPVSGEGG